MAEFIIESKYTPTGDQPSAIEKIVNNFNSGIKRQTLLGATGTGKTFTMANVIKRVGKPTLVLAHNKTLAGQLYNELKALFPNNHVEYFISYYDYYQPEAYVVSSDTYIEKDAKINDEIDEMRHSATAALMDFDDVIVVASVSCIYGIGDPDDYKDTIADCLDDISCYLERISRHTFWLSLGVRLAFLLGLFYFLLGCVVVAFVYFKFF